MLRATESALAPPPRIITGGVAPGAMRGVVRSVVAVVTTTCAGATAFWSTIPFTRSSPELRRRCQRPQACPIARRAIAEARARPPETGHLSYDNGSKSWAAHSLRGSLHHRDAEARPGRIGSDPP